jgi:hypothetical protein
VCVNAIGLGCVSASEQRGRKSLTRRNDGWMRACDDDMI